MHVHTHTRIAWAAILRFVVVLTLTSACWRSSFAADEASFDATDQPLDKSSSSVVEELARQWLAAHDAVLTADVGVTCITAFRASAEASLLESEFRSFFDVDLHGLCVRSAEDPEIQDSIVRFLVETNLMHNGWTELLITQDGDTVRNDFAAGSDGRRNYVRTPTSELAYSGTSGTATLQAGQSRLRMYTFSDMLYLPSKPILEKLTQNSELRASGDRRYSLLKEPWLELEFDPRSGFIYRGRVTPRRSTSFTEHCQFAPTTLGDGLLLPRVSCMAKGRHVGDGRVAIEMLRVFLLRDATVNAPLPEHSFAVDAPAGTRVYVTGETGEKLLSAKLGNDVVDVRDHLEHVIESQPKTGLPAIEAEDEGKNGVSLLVYLNLIAVVIVGGLLLRKRFGLKNR